MPDIVTEHPEAVLELLASQGASCGTRLQVLSTCPPERSCTLAGGELCVRDGVAGQAIVESTTTSTSTPMFGGVALAFVVVLGLWSCRRR